MEKIYDALETLYGSSGIPFFLSDEYGNIKWRNSACGKIIIFPNGLNGNTRTEQVNVDGTLFTAQGTALPEIRGSLILWRINTLTDVLMQLGSTDTYTDICYMLSQARNDVTKAEKNSFDKSTLNNIKRNIEVLSELTTVIYHRVPRSPAIYFLEKLTQIVDNANKALSNIPIVFRLNVDRSVAGDVPVNVSERLFYVSVFSILKAMVRCSDRDLFMLKANLSENSISFSSSFTLSPDTHEGMITDDFEMYSAKLYIGYIGGNMSYTTDNGVGRVEITLPKGDSNTLNSPLYSVPGNTCEKIAEIFMGGIAGENK